MSVGQGCDKGGSLGAGVGQMTLDVREAPVHATLRRVVVWFRLLAAVWAVALIVSTLATDDGASRPWVVAVLVAILLTTIATVLLARRGQLESAAWLMVDSVVTLFTMLGPGLAEASDLFYGGYPLSWLLLLVWARPTVVTTALGVGLLVAAQVSGNVIGVRDLRVTDYVGDIAVWVVSGIVYGWAFHVIRASELRRLDAEAELEREQTRRRLADERAGIADHLHDSVLQTLTMLQHRDETDPATRDMAARQERELRRFIDRISAEYSEGLVVAMRSAAAEVEDGFGISVETAFAGDCERTEGVDALTAATREALINAARHSGAESASLFVEVGTSQIASFVRDRGSGFDATAARPSSRGIDHSMVARMERHGGSCQISSQPGRGTEVELRLPRVAQ